MVVVLIDLTINDAGGPRGDPPAPLRRCYRFVTFVVIQNTADQ
ncbi:hypothetical protein HMPREF9005_2465 [Actinomyces sp. oral taxon 178 str. F0338]|nr:hypothetical protein HMPREF9005_2465 [Actinomyces sp. oral taxon 178 str. F0338]